MKTMIWKELRENARWAVLAFLCLLLAEVFALSSTREAINDHVGITLCNNTFLFVSGFGCAGIGAVLGALQILPELRRDQWASLLHRPVPRQVIFFGKVTAGLMLYALATGPPLLVSVLYVAWPGQFAAPFVPGLALPAASDLLLGAVFYFGALLLDLHPGRWFGARGAIALGVVAVLILHLAGLWPFALPLVAGATLFAAAWGAMLGSLPAQSWLSRLALGAVMLAGVQTALLLLGAGLRGLPQQDTATLFFYTNFWMASDGTVFLRKQDSPGRSILTDMQGNIVTDERYVGNDSGNNFLYPFPFVDRERFRAREFFHRTSRSSYEHVQVIAGRYGSAEFWYLLPGNHSYFVGYDKLSARRIGICDADGFKGADAKPRPFTPEPHGELFQSMPLLFWVGPELFAFDFTERRMTPLLHAGGDTIYGAIKFPYRIDRPRIAVGLSSEIRVLDPDGAPLFTMPYGHEPGIWPSIGITATEGFSRMFLQYQPSYYGHLKGLDALVHLDVFDAQGRRVATAGRTAPLLSIPNQTKPGELAALFGFAVSLSVVAVVWARKVGLSRSRTGVWVVLTLVFGAAGFLTYRLATLWPTRVPCSRCARPRSIAAAACPHCHEAWTPLPKSGTEIFEPA